MNKASLRPASGVLPDNVLPLPRYHQIYLVLREQLAQGDFPPDAPMPGELDLAARFGVSRVTMRSALDKLDRDGLIIRQRGRGTFARAPGSAVPPANAEVRGMLENLVSMSLKTSVRILELGMQPAAPDVARELDMPVGAKVQKAVRIRSFKEGPLAYITTFVPEDIGRHFGRRELASRPMLVLLEEAGVKVDSADQTVSARLADHAVAPLLDLDIGAPLLAVTRVVRDKARRPVQLLRGLYRPDRYEYQMHLSRAGRDEARIWVSRD